MLRTSRLEFASLGAARTMHGTAARRYVPVIAKSSLQQCSIQTTLSTTVYGKWILPLSLSAGLASGMGLISNSEGMHQQGMPQPSSTCKTLAKACITGCKFTSL